MFYKELKDIDFGYNEREKSILRLKNEFGINAPNSVIEQFYLDHRDKESFLELYGHINLHTIKWTLIKISTKDLLTVSGAATYPDFIKEVSKNVALCHELNDIDTRADVVHYWKNYATWKTPPIFIDGTKLKKPTRKLHLVEGHTRIGNLKGIFSEKLIDLADFHKIYYGNCNL